MTAEHVGTLVIGGGQAGLAMSEHLSRHGVSHLVVERDRVAESWRTRRWDSLVANGPAWHDRFPGLEFAGIDPEAFASKQMIVAYFEQYARQIDAPIRCGVEVTALRARSVGGFRVETTAGAIDADNIVVATGPFQHPVIPALVPAGAGFTQLHSHSYRNPDQLPNGAVLVVGAGSSGVQIAEEINKSGRQVFLAVGPHSRPPRRYRGRDFCWWLGALGIWDMKTRDPGTEHVTIAVSGARGGHTVDFRQLAAEGITLVGRARAFEEGVMHFASDLAKSIADGDADYLSVLDQADAYIIREKLDWPEDREARAIGADTRCITDPILSLDLAQAGISAIIWATGYALDFDWLKVDVFDKQGRPEHTRGVSRLPGLYFLGLPWLSRRASAFIFGVWHDAEYISERIATRAVETVCA